MHECNAVVINAALDVAAKELGVRAGDAVVRGHSVLFALKVRGVEATVSIRASDEVKRATGPATWYQICHDVLSAVVGSAGDVPWTSGVVYSSKFKFNSVRTQNGNT